MSEELNPKQLPHEMLLSRYGLSMEDMGTHTKQLKTDLDKTLRLVLNRAKDGAIKLTPATQTKIETYDRYICDGIFEYLEDNEQISSEKADALEKQADVKREEVKEQMEEIHEEAVENQTKSKEETSETTDTKTEETPTPTSKPKEDEDDGRVRIGFWDWE